MVQSVIRPSRRSGVGIPTAPRDMDEVFTEVEASLPEMVDDLRSLPAEAEEQLNLSRDVKCTLAEMVGKLEQAPDDPRQLALSAAAAAAQLGALDGVVAYVANKMPLPMAPSGEAGPDAVSAGFNQAGADSITRLRDQLRDNGPESLREFVTTGRQLAASAVETPFEDLQQYRHALCQAMLVSYTVGAAQACVASLVVRHPCRPPRPLSMIAWLKPPSVPPPTP